MQLVQFILARKTEKFPIALNFAHWSLHLIFEVGLEQKVRAEKKRLLAFQDIIRVS